MAEKKTIAVFRRIDIYYHEDEIGDIAYWLMNEFDVPPEYEAADLKNELLLAKDLWFNWLPEYYFTMLEDDDEMEDE